MDTNLLLEAQFTRAAVYHVLGYYIFPRLSTFSTDGDIFREKMKYYRTMYSEEITKLMQDGIKYDYDSSGTIEASEKQPTHFGRLVR